MADIEKLNFNKVIGSKIRKARKANGVLQEDLAKAVNLSRTSVVNIEEGRQAASVLLLLKFATILATDIHNLLPDSSEFKPKIRLTKI